MIENAQPERRETIREIRARHKPKEQLPQGWTPERAQEHEVHLSREREAHLQALAATDELTGLENRRSFVQHMNAAFTRLIEGKGRKNSPRNISIALIDTDRFKEINDTYGHDAGDRVLKKIANVLRSMIREGYDHVDRHGGDEWTIGFVDVDQETAVNKMQALVERMREHEIDIGGGMIIKGITLSIGVTTASRGRGARTLEDAIKQADTAMYQAKASGRNQVALSLNSAGPPSIYQLGLRS